MELNYYSGDNHVRVMYWVDNFTLADVLCAENEGVDWLEIWYPTSLSSDIKAYYGNALKYIEPFASWGMETHSLSIDLAKNEQDIFAEMDKTRRYKVHRAMRERMEIEIMLIDERSIRLYLELQNTGERSHPVLENKVKSAMEENSFYLAVCKDEKENTVAMHGYLTDREKLVVSLFSSKSFYNHSAGKSFVSRGNSLLHFKSILFFKALGFRVYDFGGLYMATEQTDANKKLLQISEFKKSFGGNVTSFVSGICVPIKNTRTIVRNIERLLALLKGNDVVLWGVGFYGRFALEKLKGCGITPRWLIDNKLAQNNDKYQGQDILSQCDYRNTVILVSTSPTVYKEILKENLCKDFQQRQRIFCLQQNV